MKTCTKCSLPKAETEFYERKGSTPERPLYQAACKSCQNKAAVAWRKTPTGWASWKRAHLKKYGMTLEQWDALAAQYPVCPGCQRPFGAGFYPCVDHDHNTGEIRGMLCNGCNKAVGFAVDDPNTLRSLAAYLDTWRKT